MGRSGRALILLTPNEASYVEFLRRRKVFLLPVEGEGGVDGMGSEEGGAQGKEEEDTEDTAAATGASSTATLTNSLTSALRRFAETDRDVMEKGIKAFLSFLRGYGEHVCSFLFRVQDLQVRGVRGLRGLWWVGTSRFLDVHQGFRLMAIWKHHIMCLIPLPPTHHHCYHHHHQVGPLASTFALLRIPKTPEVRKLIGQGTKGEAVSVQGFVPSTVDPAAVPVCVCWGGWDVLYVQLHDNIYPARGLGIQVHDTLHLSTHTHTHHKQTNITVQGQAPRATAQAAACPCCHQH